ncbi:hypothetical protein [Helicobacter cetorum]|uniref:hypothetical protein n=1 Tax=Helicobacter cetorum TaxID=138563 RepID=UPI000CF0883A|nr:hypothetical protein [Helicobacter cetorum]
MKEERINFISDLLKKLESNCQKSLANQFLQKVKEICALKGLEEFEYNDTNFAFKCGNTNKKPSIKSHK